MGYEWNPELSLLSSYSSSSSSSKRSCFHFHSQKKNHSPPRFSQHFSIFSPNFQKSSQITSQPSIHTPPLLLTPCWSPWRNPASVPVRRTWWMNDPRHDVSTWSRPGSWITAIPVGPEACHQWVVKKLHVFSGCELTPSRVKRLHLVEGFFLNTSETHVVKKGPSIGSL